MANAKPKNRAPAKPSAKPRGKAASRVMGRPRVEIDFRHFEALCNIFCTLTEIASVLNVSDDTIERRCVEHYGETFKEAWERLSAGGRMSIRRAQFSAATAGNPTMLIWMGKQFLAQVERQELSGPGGESLTQPIANAIDKIYGKTE